MSFLITLFVIILQIVVGQFAGFVTTMALGIGNGGELLMLPLGNTFGVWLVGVIAATLRGTYDSKDSMLRLLGTFICSALGVGLILITNPMGGVQILFPLIGALIGYYLAPYYRIRK